MRPSCPRCKSSLVIRYGSFRRVSDGRRVQRFSCSSCSRSFSYATAHPCFRQKKRQFNHLLRELFASGVSQRRAARILHLNPITVVRKFLFLAKQAEISLTQMNTECSPATCVEFDDLETIEHTKLKPLSVPMMIEFKTRRILGFEVAQMPSKGLLAKISRKKYGPRADHRPEARKRLFNKVKPLVSTGALIKCDESPHYPADVARYFPTCELKTFKGRRSCIAGQGELKKIGFDPIFSINHTFAMLRANINRLFRRTWCTTKKPERLYLHLLIYADYHNSELIRCQSQA